MRRIKVVAVSVLLAVSMLLSMAVCVSAASQVEITNYGICGAGVTKAQAKRAAKKIGKMKAKKSKRYKTAYYKGNKMIIGINKNVNTAKYSYPYPPYSYIVNKGNKRVTYRGVRIGDSKATVDRKMGRGYRTKKNVYQYGGAGGYLNCTFKKGKLKSWVFDCSPTS